MRGLLVVLALVSTALAGCAANDFEDIQGADGTGTGPGVPPADAGENGDAGSSFGGHDLSFFGIDGDPFFGDANATVQVVAFDAPGCVICNRYHQAKFPAVYEDFVATGRIGYHMQQWTVGYRYDRDGGVALECAHREGGSPAYFDLHEIIFGDDRNPDLKAALSTVATGHGLDEAVLHACLDGEETLDAYQQDLDFGRSSGAGSNPGFAIVSPDGSYVFVKSGNGPYDAIAKALGDA